MDIPSIAVILLIGLVGYIYWLQGLLSGFINAVTTIFAACIAVTYYEPLANAMSGGKFNDQAHGVYLIALFALVLLILRIVFDSLIPGNIRVPAIADKIGGAVFGAVAAMFGLGVVMIGCQYFPFGPSIGGYARYALKDTRDVKVPPAQSGAALDRKIYDELKDNSFDVDPQRMLVPADDLVVGLVSHLSSEGALANERPFKAIHPNLLQELFAQRIGVQPGVKRTALNGKKGDQVRLDNIYLLARLPRQSAEVKEVRPEDYTGPTTRPMAPGAGKQLIAITVMFTVDAADELDGDRFVRLGPGAVRLVAKVGDEWKNYYPLGTVQKDRIWTNRLDDFLFIKVSGEDRGAHFVFEVDKDVVQYDKKTQELTRDDVFLEVKRLTRFPLQGRKLISGNPPSQKIYYPVRKVQLYDENTEKDPTQVATGGNTPENPNPNPANPDNNTNNPPNNPDNTPKPPDNPPSENGWDQAPLEKPALTVSDKLPIGIATNTTDADALIDTDGVSANMEAKKFTLIETKIGNPASAQAALSKGTNPITQLAVPAGNRMLQVKLAVKKTANSGDWASNLGSFAISDGASALFKPRGIHADVTAGAVKKLLVKFDHTQELSSIDPPQGTVPSITLLFILPANVKAKELRFQEKPGGLPLEK